MATLMSGAVVEISIRPVSHEKRLLVADVERLVGGSHVE
jgi:hypothetical protein